MLSVLLFVGVIPARLASSMQVGCCLQVGCMQVCVQVYARMSNKHLGQIMLPKTFGKDVFKTIRNLQEQGAKLLTHTRRPCEYLQVFVDGRALPTLTYKTHTDILGSSLVEQVMECFEKTTSKTRVELMWNEDDTKALAEANCHPKYNYHDSEKHLIVVATFRWQPEFKVLAYAFDVAKLTMYNLSTEPKKISKNEKALLALLISMPNVTEVKLEMLSIQSWDFASKTNIKVLRLVETPITASDLAKFPCLKNLTLEGTYPLGGLRVSSLETLGLTRLRMSMRCTRDDQVESFKDDVSTCTIVDAEITIDTVSDCNIKLHTWRSTNRAWT